MKLLKKLFYGTAILIMLCCAGMLIVALTPGMSESLSRTLYGENGPSISDSGSIVPDGETSGGQTADGTDIYGDISGIASGVLASENSAGYVAPIRGSLNLPDQVVGKSGYEPISGTAEELAEDQANEVGSKLGTGETGEEFTFDAEMFPYYHMLNSKMQRIYRQIYANALALKDSFAPVEQVNTAQLKNVFEAVYNDHPELFWMETEYSCKYRADGTCVEVELSYNRTAQNLSKTTEEFNTQVQKILEGAKNQKDIRGMETYVHDALLKQAEYVASAPMNQSAYSALVSGGTVCAGYSRAFQYMMMQLGIPCYYCTGYSGEDHAWNIIKLEDGYYNVDTTWDDTNPATYDYFNKSDADFVGTHVRTGLSVYLPPCGVGLDSNVSNISSLPVGSDRPAGITLNPNPTQPLTWVPKKDGSGKDKTPDKTSDKTSDSSTVSGSDAYDLKLAGVSEDDVLDSMEKYYADCLRQMEKVGSGQKTFSNVVPKYVLTLVERCYGTGDYYKNYAEAGLKKLKKENFAIQIQVQDLGGNYFRLYHNISTW